MKSIFYKDFWGTYRITEQKNGLFLLCCYNTRGVRWHRKEYRTERGAKIALSKLCGGLPQQKKQEFINKKGV